MTTPEKIGPYEVKSELGRGGMATVYRAYDPRVDREVAIKVLPREMLHDPQFHVRFEREIKMIAKLEHPAIVPIYDVGDVDGQPYYVMRYMSGGSLSDWIEKGGFSIQDTARIIERLASGLAYAHMKGVIHRDIKPGNILFDQNGDPYLSDFGVAHFTEAATNVTGSAVIGTPAYMSPEQAQSMDIDGRSDVYGLGAIIYEMLSGNQPYSADTPMGVVVKHITEPVPEILLARADLPEAVDAVIKTAMAKDRDNRFSTTAELAKALNAVAQGEKPALPEARPAAPRKGAGGSRRVIIPVGFGLLVIAMLIGAFVFRERLPFASTQSTETASPTEALPTSTVPVPSPTSEAPAVSNQPQFAPICEERLPVCEPPTAEVLDKFCVSKVPYTLLALPENTSFETVSPELRCTDEGVRGGDQQVSCSGPDLLSFDMKVCDTNCEAAELFVDEDLCPPRHGYYAAGECCAPMPPGPPKGQPQLEPGCALIKVDLRGCDSN